MDTAGANDHIDSFVLELLRTGCMLTDIVADLVEELPKESYPGEEPAAVVIEMLCGTIATALVFADRRDVRRATGLIGLAAARTLEHLQLACDLSRRIHGDAGRIGPTYG